MIRILTLLFILSLQQPDCFSQTISDTTIYKTAERLPEFPGGDIALISWLRQEIKYPDSAKNHHAGGIVETQFVIEKDGSISNIKTLKGPAYGCREEVIRVINEMPAWKAGSNNGEPVRMLYQLPVSFIAKTDSNDYYVHPVIEHMPQYPGGDKAMYAFLSENIKYPKTAIKKGIEGKVYIQFEIDTSGRVTNAKIARGIGGGCDEEALRVIKAMPAWRPGMQQGRLVRVSYTMPVLFSTKKSKTKK